MTRPDLVIFDCDGVLVDSEPIANRVFAEHLTAAGFSMTTEEAIRTLKGRSMKQCIELIEQRFGRALPERFVETLQAATGVAFARELGPVPGIAAALDRIACPVCVASSGEHVKMRFTLGLTGLLPRFDGRLFSATEVARGKPAPDLFLHAASRMGMPPAGCAVIEDSALGVDGAVAAGMRAFGFAGASCADPAALAAAGATLFGAMEELPGLLGF